MIKTKSERETRELDDFIRETLKDHEVIDLTTEQDTTITNILKDDIASCLAKERKKEASEGKDEEKKKSFCQELKDMFGDDLLDVVQFAKIWKNTKSIHDKNKQEALTEAGDDILHKSSLKSFYRQQWINKSKSLKNAVKQQFDNKIKASKTRFEYPDWIFRYIHNSITPPKFQALPLEKEVTDKDEKKRKVNDKDSDKNPNSAKKQCTYTAVSSNQVVGEAVSSNQVVGEASSDSSSDSSDSSEEEVNESLLYQRLIDCSPQLSKYLTWFKNHIKDHTSQADGKGCLYKGKEYDNCRSAYVAFQKLVNNSKK